MKKRIVIITIIVALLAFSIFFAVFLAQRNDNKTTLYFADLNRGTLKAELREIAYETEEELLNRALEALIIGPSPSSECVGLIPKGTQLKSVSIDNDCVLIDFSQQLLAVDNDVDRLLTRYSIVKTVCELSDQFAYVRLTVDGEPLYDNYGNGLGMMSVDDTFFDAVSTEQKKVKAILYFADSTGQNLVAEEREVSVKSAETVAFAILQELIGGPATKQLVGTIPSGTKILSADVKNGVCYVDFSPAFVEKHVGGSTGEILTVYSVVNTLTALEGIDKVQFLINGKTREIFGNLLFSEPFVSNIR